MSGNIFGQHSSIGLPLGRVRVVRQVIVRREIVRKEIVEKAVVKRLIKRKLRTEVRKKFSLLERKFTFFSCIRR